MIEEISDDDPEVVAAMEQLRRLRELERDIPDVIPPK